MIFWRLSVGAYTNGSQFCSVVLVVIYRVGVICTVLLLQMMMLILTSASQTTVTTVTMAISPNKFLSYVKSTLKLQYRTYTVSEKNTSRTLSIVIKNYLPILIIFGTNIFGTTGHHMTGQFFLPHPMFASALPGEK